LHLDVIYTTINFTGVQDCVGDANVSVTEVGVAGCGGRGQHMLSTEKQTGI